MSTPFDGSWTDPNGTKVAITSNFQVLTVQYANQPAPHPGFYLAAGSGVACVNWDVARAGLLLDQGQTILWDNLTKWTKSS